MSARNRKLEHTSSFEKLEAYSRQGKPITCHTAQGRSHRGKLRTEIQFSNRRQLR